MSSQILRMILLVIFLVATSAVSQAQDAEQVLQTKVAYTTTSYNAKSDPKITDAQRTEMDRLERLAVEATRAGKYGEALKNYYHAFAVARGTEWTPNRAFGNALTMKIDHALVEPSQVIKITIGQIYALDDKLTGSPSASIELRGAAGNEPGKVLKEIETLSSNLDSRPLITEIAAPDAPDGNYRLAVTVKLGSSAGNTETVSKAVPIRIEHGITARLAPVQARAAKLEATLQAGHKDDLLDALAEAEYDLSLFNLADRSEVNFARTDLGAGLKEATSIMDSVEAGKSPFTGQHGELAKAYKSKVDDTFQPYRVFIPSSYDGTKPFPVVIALHGMGGNEKDFFAGYGNGAIKLEAEKRGYIVACPKGRQPASMYAGPAQQDVMDVLSEVRRAYRVDPDRIYLMGHSMGGYGTWTTAIKYPNVWAALAPISGGGNPAALAPIARIPQIVVHGDNDATVPVGSSRQMVEALRKLGAEVKYIEVPGGTHGSVAAPAFKDIFDWFDAHRRKPGAQSSVQSSSFSLRSFENGNLEVNF